MTTKRNERNHSKPQVLLCCPALPQSTTQSLTELNRFLLCVQAPLSTGFQSLQQKRSGQLLPEGRRHVSLQYAQHEGPGGGQEMWQWLCGGRRRM